jgi:GAF domain-containing protein
MSKRSFPVPPNEAARLDELHRLQVLDTPAGEATDRIIRLAAAVFHAPTAFISLMDADRQWFKARRGLDLSSTPREIAFCAYAIMADELMIVPDTVEDPRFRRNPLVTGGMRVRFYAGAPLVTSRGFAIGTLCVLDRIPHPPLTAPEKQLLTDLAALAVEALER